jgi:hypothetical protein
MSWVSEWNPVTRHAINIAKHAARHGKVRRRLELPATDDFILYALHSYSFNAGEEVSVRAFGQSAAQQMSMLSSMTQAGPSGCTSALDLLNKSKTSPNAKKVGTLYTQP